MSQFLSDLDVRLKFDNECVWVVDSPLIYESDLLGLIEIPTTFETDFASVPRIPIIYFSWGAKAHREAVVHDYLYRIDSVPQATYSQANKVFYEAMKTRNKKILIRYPMFFGVVLGGWASYHKKNVFDKIN